jgi:7-cyano-7-deazaguanine synthase
MDSTTMLACLLAEGYEIHAFSFYYGSKHNKYEKEAVEKIIEYYKERNQNIHIHYVNLSEAFKEFESALLLTGEAIPEGHYEEDSMRKTVVPGRNMIFASIMAGYAESIGAEYVALGVHQGDHHIYPDCRREFIKAFDSAVYLSSGGTVSVLTPLIDDNKTSILVKGYSLPESQPVVPYQLTRTCYKDQQDSCSKCGSCRERLEAFANINKIDPISYE